MALRFRLLPSVIVAALALLSIKLVDLWSDGAFTIAAAWAQSGAAAPPAAAANPPSPAPAPASDPASAPAAAKDDAPPSGEPKPATAEKGARDPMQMSPAEVGELQQLSERRTELDQSAAELRERAVLMQAAEKRIDEKIAKLQELQKTIEASVKAKNDQDDQRLQSLAHMYEQMKPQEAARILDQLDVPIVLTMLSHMREQKAAPILATMDPSKAKAVTLALAEQKSPPGPAPAPANAAGATQ
jgi:flagellar motility protein MotE (MotC chaperone)